LACGPQADVGFIDNDEASQTPPLGAFATPSLRLLTRKRVCLESESSKDLKMYLQVHDQRSAQSKKSKIGMVSDKLPFEPLQDAQIEKLMIFLCSLQVR
jgi:hypothetical protein